MVIQILLLLADSVLINLAFILSFLIRYRASIPETSFQPYKDNFVFLTVIYMLIFGFTRVFKRKFTSFWDLFKRIFVGLFLGTLLGFVLVYVFRIQWGGFPSSIFVISFPLGVLSIFSVNALFLKFAGRIKKKVIVVGKEKGNGMIENSAYVEKIEVDSIEAFIKYKDVDEIIICEKVHDEKILNLLIYLLQKINTNIFFHPDIYAEIISENFNGNETSQVLATFLGKKSDIEEFLIRVMDIVGSLIMLIISGSLVALVSVLIKITSQGPVLYKQDRAGKDGKIFTLYKFRTMIQDAEKLSGLTPTVKDDTRVTKVGKWLRITRLDELPQLLNVLKGDMSLVGPRPENLYRVETHKALQGIRLAVRPGLTGLAQVRSFYDLKPQHKIKYDYLYIQRRSLRLNLYILAKTIPVIFSKKGW